MTKFYFYPKIKLKASDIQNLYAKDFENAIAVYHEVVNKEVNAKGVIDFFKHLSNTDVYLFNWIEDLPRRKFGKLQVFLFMLFIGLVKIRRKKIIWILHNKYSHNMASNRWTDFMFKTMMKNADLILTHSNEGIEFAKKKYPKYAHKIKYEIHPIKDKLDSTSKEKKFDFLFWGSIHPYKDIVKFLQFVKTNTAIVSPKILIVGRCYDEEYKKRIRTSLSAEMIFENQFYEMEEIAEFAAQSRFILFTYNADSVLSSGALMDSIRMNADIIGPRHGAFKDLNYLPSIHVYDTFDDIVSIANNSIQNEADKDNSLTQFLQENSWNKFAKKIKGYTEDLMN